MSAFINAMANCPDASVLETGANRQFLLDEGQTVWFVTSGLVDLFVVEVDDGKPVGTHTPLCQVSAENLFLGLPSDGPWQILCMPGVDTKLLSVPLAFVRSGFVAGLMDDAGSLLEAWIQTLTRPMFGTVDRVRRVKAGDTLALEAQAAIAPVHGLLWATPTEGKLGWDPFLSSAFGTGVKLPFSTASCLVAVEAGGVSVEATATAVGSDAAWEGLKALHQVAMAAMVEKISDLRQKQAERLRLRAVREKEAVDQALDDLAAPLSGRDPATVRYSDALLEAARIVGESVGLEIRRPRRSTQGIAADALWHIARASRCQTREVSLNGRWWRADNGPLLGFLADGAVPVALLPLSPRRYEMVDPRTGTRTRVTARVAAGLQTMAFVLYRNLPERPLKALDLLSFGLRTTWGELVSIFTVGILSGLLALIVPLGTSLLVNTIIPTGQTSELYDLTVAMIACAIGSGCYSVTRAIATLRMEGRMENEVQSALFTRLLMLQAPFFRQFSSGDLANRLLGVNSIRQTMTSTATNSLLTGVFSVFSYLLLFYYSWKLAVVASLLVFGYIVVNVSLTLAQIHQQRAILDLEGSIQGLVLQLLLGISKMRVAGAEPRAYREWAALFARQRQLKLRNRMINVWSKSFSATYKVLVSLCLFAFMAWSDYKLTDPGDFMAFYTSFGQFFTAMTSMASAITTAQTIRPTLMRAEPILTAPLEVTDARPDPGHLNGELEVKDVCFRYAVDGPLNLDNVSLVAHPGEMIAVVGPSGSGKSTLLRMLLGFEKPESGDITYDGQSLGQVDVQAVRRQIGVVLQDGKLMPGDIFYNIVGSTLLTVEDAWEAARVAAIDEDIQNMPMGMHTVLMEGATTFSGGQRQRLMIARAVVARPRYLFLDEATSALDGTVQEQVSRAMEGIQATRVVIAHRLSTIRNADRIYVLHNGKIEQVGTFEELVAVPGLFQDLARRQMA